MVDNTAFPASTGAPDNSGTVNHAPIEQEHITRRYSTPCGTFLTILTTSDYSTHSDVIVSMSRHHGTSRRRTSAGSSDTTPPTSDRGSASTKARRRSHGDRRSAPVALTSPPPLPRRPGKSLLRTGGQRSAAARHPGVNDNPTAGDLSQPAGESNDDKESCVESQVKSRP